MGAEQGSGNNVVKLVKKRLYESVSWFDRMTEII